VQDDGGDVEEGGWDCAGDGDGVSCISCVEVVEVEGGCRGEEAIVVLGFISVNKTLKEQP
jgi:hypothetical protein